MYIGNSLVSDFMLRLVGLAFTTKFDDERQIFVLDKKFLLEFTTGSYFRNFNNFRNFLFDFE